MKWYAVTIRSRIDQVYHVWANDSNEAYDEGWDMHAMDEATDGQITEYCGTSVEELSVKPGGRFL